MKRVIQKYYKIFFLIIFVGLFYFIVSSNMDKLFVLGKISFLNLFFLSVFIFFNFLSSGFALQIAFRSFGIKLKYRESFGINVLKRFYNYFFIKGGVFIKLAYFSKVKKIKLKNIFLILSFLELARLLALLTIFFVAFLFLSSKVSYFFYFVFLFLALIFFKIYTKNKSWSFVKKIDFVEKQIRQHFKVFFLVYFLNITTVLSSAFIFFFIYKILFLPLNIFKPLLLVSSGFLSSYLAITPASLGWKEMVVSYVHQLFGGNFTDTLIVVAVDRALLMFWIFLLGFMINIFFYNKQIKRYDK